MQELLKPLTHHSLEIKSVSEGIKTWPKRGTESERRGPEWISAVGSGLGERSETWQSTAMWADTGKSTKYTSSTQKPGRSQGQVRVLWHDETIWHVEPRKSNKIRGLHKNSCLKPEVSLKTANNTNINNTESKILQQILAPFGVSPPQNKPVCLCVSLIDDRTWRWSCWASVLSSPSSSIWEPKRRGVKTEQERGQGAQRTKRRKGSGDPCCVALRTSQFFSSGSVGCGSNRFTRQGGHLDKNKTKQKRNQIIGGLYPCLTDVSVCVCVFLCLPAGCLTLHVHQVDSQPVSDLHLHVSPQHSEPEQGNSTQACCFPSESPVCG